MSREKGRTQCAYPRPQAGLIGSMELGPAGSWAGGQPGVSLFGDFRVAFISLHVGNEK